MLGEEHGIGAALVRACSIDIGALGAHFGDRLLLTHGKRRRHQSINRCGVGRTGQADPTTETKSGCDKRRVSAQHRQARAVDLEQQLERIRGNSLAREHADAGDPELLLRASQAIGCHARQLAVREDGEVGGVSFERGTETHYRFIRLGTL